LVIGLVPTFLYIDNTIYKVNICINTLDILNPIKLLKSGYSIVTKDNDVVNSDNVAVGDKVDIITNDIKIMATVDSVIKK
jgi:exonuclease VII large subunit